MAKTNEYSWAPKIRTLERAELWWKNLEPDTKVGIAEELYDEEEQGFCLDEIEANKNNKEEDAVKNEDEMP